MRGVNGLGAQVLHTRPVRYRSKATGRWVTEAFAREHPDETYAVNRGTPVTLAVAGLGALLVLAVSAGVFYRARR
jgi:hypothetical protein